MQYKGIVIWVANSNVTSDELNDLCREFLINARKMPLRKAGLQPALVSWTCGALTGLYRVAQRVLPSAGIKGFFLHCEYSSFIAHADAQARLLLNEYEPPRIAREMPKELKTVFCMAELNNRKCRHLAKIIEAATRPLQLVKR